MFKKWIYTCFGINTDEKNNESIRFNQIKNAVSNANRVFFAKNDSLIKLLNIIFFIKQSSLYN